MTPEQFVAFMAQWQSDLILAMRQLNTTMTKLIRVLEKQEKPF